MSKWKIALSAAVFAAALAPAAHADEFNKLTLLTFSAPVDVPGMTLPAGTYRFALADPESGRRAVKVTDKDGTKTYGMFLSIPNQRMKPTDKPVVMFKEAPAGAPPAVQVWFYPGETYGYEFAYPHEQALKIARATHEPVLAQTGNEIARVDENDRPVSTDEALKESSAPHASVATTAPPQPATTTAPQQPATTTATTTSEQPAAPAATPPAASTTTAPAPTAVGTSGTTSVSEPRPRPTDDAAQPAAKPARKHLPRTASNLPLLALLSLCSLGAAAGVRLARAD
jgi:hypothetical protein